MFKKLLISLVLCFTAAWIGSSFTMPELNTWYVGLKKSFFNPPNVIFGPVWTILYALMAISLSRVWQSRGSKRNKHNAYIVFALQIILNVLWSYTFFALHNLVLAVIVICLLWLAILGMIFVFKKQDKLSAFLQIPYLLWVSFATILTIAVASLNS